MREFIYITQAIGIAVFMAYGIYWLIKGDLTNGLLAIILTVLINIQLNIREHSE